MEPAVRPPADAPEAVLVRCAARAMQFDLSVWAWGDAIAVDGLLDVTELTGDPAPAAYVLGFLDRWSRRDHTWADHLAPGHALVRLAVDQDRADLLDAAKRLADWLTVQVPRTPDGAPMYRPDLPLVRHRVWVDSIYHVPPFLALLARHGGGPGCVEQALECLDAHLAALADPAGGPWLHHAYDAGPRVRLGLGWGRGVGWAFLGLVDLYAELPADHPGRTRVAAHVTRLADALCAAQDGTGFWPTLVHDRESYVETSTAGFFGAGLAKAIRLGILSTGYRGAVDAAWRAVLLRVADDGSVRGVSGKTTENADPAYYKALPTEVNVWGQGSVLRIAAELMRL